MVQMPDAQNVVQIADMYSHLFRPGCCESHLWKLIGILSARPNFVNQATSRLYCLQDFT